jgi:putative nucleotidyltransferase with HDIG domain
MPGSYGHLASRFFDYLRARPLDEAEIQDVRALLSDEEARLYFDQSPRDQAHGYAAAMVVRAACVDREETLKAALLHDVGKTQARLGLLGRILASLMIKLRVPLSRRMAAYRDHGPMGAAELSEAGSATLVVEFARNHHGARPEAVGEEDWDLLQKADIPANARLARRRR